MSALTCVAPTLSELRTASNRVFSRLSTQHSAKAASSIPSPRSLRREVFKFGGSSVGSPEAFRNVAGVLLAGKDAGLQ